MGRVQSATLHLICQRETEILTFVPEDYWSVWVEYIEGFKAFYRRNLNNTTPANNQQPDDAKTEADKAPESDRVSSQAEADRLVSIAKNNPHQVIQVERKTTQKTSPVKSPDIVQLKAHKKPMKRFVLPISTDYQNKCTIL